ncbi:NO-inducible flavohemoprotein [Erwinia tasmaniensis]|uniref:nitric oxide dioxygenase n=1 Tax=Erwinia tasmaniensis (strain DSM 17950 / CFBP 7177 / CIP 109463 / NCPPB 4357 / Et1/99) TaxID=465817 RepID=B2VI24_ERWT9|nr:NO-inducible flavohemoprotein [Erwinia tasmaniensis]CAO96058.1 Flavohemoprotein (Nitric oxide dioxygenase) [Erwinia tasmaniensis Et1/99]
MLDSQTIATVKSTLPAVAELGPRLTEHFYQRLFDHHPELKDIFNMSNQSNGNQRVALFNAIAAYASNLDNLAALGPAVEKIAQKHTTFAVSPAQYAVVGQHLLATIDEMLHPGDDVLAAWGKAYGVLAGVFVQREEQIYQQSEEKSGGWRGQREFVISEVIPQGSMIKSFVLTPVDGRPVADYRPGQYLALWVTDPSFENQEIRQYSLTRTPNGRDYRIAVRHQPGGTLSSWLHQQQPGSRLHLSPPAGDFFIDIDARTPVALISGGVGLTPMLAMLHKLAQDKHPAPVQWLHATENGNTHAFAEEVSALGARLPDFSQHIWYQHPLEEDKGTCHHRGLMDLLPLKSCFSDRAQHYYLCGPLAFMRSVEQSLVQLGVGQSHIHYEVFGPHSTL